MERSVQSNGWRGTGGNPARARRVERLFNVTEHHLFIVTPITGTDRNLNYQVKIEDREGGLSKNSIIMCEQIRSADTRRFLTRRGVVSPETLARVRKIVSMFLNELPA